VFYDAPNGQARVLGGGFIVRAHARTEQADRRDDAALISARAS
jgi:hypothetical protein